MSSNQCRQPSPKVSMPSAEENIPCASGQAMALHYAPKVSQHSQWRQGRATAGLPDLTDRLKKLGMFESYKAWTANYAKWRSGAAFGAKGELTAVTQGSSLKTVGEQPATGLPDLSERLRQNGTYEKYQAWSREYKQWRQGAAKGAKGELSDHSAPHRVTNRPSMKKVDWPEACECLPTAEGQSVLLHKQPQVQMASVRSKPSAAILMRAHPSHLQEQPQVRPLMSRPQARPVSRTVSWPQAEEDFPGAHGQAMALHHQAQVVRAQ